MQRSLLLQEAPDAQDLLMQAAPDEGGQTLQTSKYTAPPDAGGS